MNYLTCTGKVKIAFIYQVASFWPSWGSVYEACMADERFEVKLFWVDGSEGDRAQMENSQDYLIEQNIPYEEFSHEKVMEFYPHYMIYQTPYDYGHRPESTWTIRYKRKGIRIVYIPYGIEISDTEESRYKHFSMSVVLNAYRVYVLSEAMKAEYEKHCFNAKAVKALGLPRFDSLKRHYELPGEIQERIAGRKIILWKSHFPKVFVENGVKKQATPDMAEYLKFVEFIEVTQDVFFIFMPHPKFADETIDEMLRPDAVRLLERLSGLPNVYIDKEADYRNSLTNADAIIIDRSAVMVEAGVRGVPVLYMYNDAYQEPMPEPIQKLLDSYEQGTKSTHMEEFCKRVIQGEDSKKQERTVAFQECVPCYEKGCTDAILEDLWTEAHKDTVFEMLEKIEDGSKVIMFTTGGIGEKCMRAYFSKPDRGFSILCFADNDKRKHGKTFCGKTTISADELKDKEYDYIVIATTRYYKEVYLQLTEDLGIDRSKLISSDKFIIMMRYE